METRTAVKQTFLDIEPILTLEEKDQVLRVWKEKRLPKTHIAIDLFLRRNLVECLQPRRIKRDMPLLKTRHMLCTRNFWLAKKMARLKGIRLKVLDEKQKAWYRDRGIILVWDIVFNDWRMIDVRRPSAWWLIDFVPFETEDQFKKVANIWVRDFKRIKYPDGPGVRTYCNFLRRGERIPFRLKGE